MPKVAVWIIGDQLLAQHPALIAANAQTERAQIDVILIESVQRTRQQPYQLKKLVLLFSAMRHYAHDLKEHGYNVHYLKSDSFLDGLKQYFSRDDSAETLITMASASYHARQQQNNLPLPTTVLANTQFLTGQYNPIPQPEPNKRYVLETFYRAMRKQFNVLMDGDQPLGGKWNFDHDNRKKLPKSDAPPPDIRFALDDITQQVMAELADLPSGIGSVEGFAYGVTRQDALQAFDNFIRYRLHKFGPYEDALAQRSHSLYHSILTPYLNIGLLEPLELVQRVEQAYRDGLVPINSAEGFIRQILGWREFMYWQYWRQMPEMPHKNGWDAHNPLPEFVWTGDTDMSCMQHAIRRAIDTGYNHHIERLMVLSNYFMLTGINPKAVNDWFLSLYIDAYDWVMPPNVIGMSLNADGGLTSTKPYIASANYINKMGDMCRNCRYNPKQRTGDDACPFNFLYWNFVLKNADKLRANARTSRAVLGLRHLDDADREAVQIQAEAYIAAILGTKSE